MSISFRYINDTYGLHLKRGTRCVYTGGSEPRRGVVVSTTGAHINIRFDDAPDGNRVVGPFHPTWGMEYPEDDEVTSTCRGSG